MDRARLLHDLSDPRAYPFALGAVEHRETHISLLFFAGDRVYKVKKSVAFEFLDARDLQVRRHLCHEEVRLNRRLAPAVYLDVVTIELREEHLSIGRPDELAAAPEPVVVDYAVEMRRLPAARMLDRLLDAGTVSPAMLDRLVDRLVRFHADAATGQGVDAFGAPEAVRSIVETNLEELSHLAGPAGELPATILALATSFLEGELTTHAALLARRPREHRIRDGHGDLHAGNICFTDDGVVVYDCIEFSAALRCCDVARDLAFLVMDLERHDRRDLAASVVTSYAERAGDPQLASLLPLYKTHLASVRGKVCALAARANADDHEMAEAARAYFQLMAGYALPPAVIVLAGLPGVGKSWLAQRLASALGATTIRSDLVRKREAGLDATARVTGVDAEALYAPESTLDTYRVVSGEMMAQLEVGRSVIVDASCSTRALRDLVLNPVRDAGRPWAFVHVTAPDDVVRARLRDRAHDRDEPSDAGLAWYDEARLRFELPDDVPRAHRLEWSSVTNAASAMTTVLSLLAEQVEI